METENRKPFVLRAIALSLLVFVLSVIALVYALFAQKEPANITNYDQESNKYETQLTNDEIKNLKETIKKVATINYGYTGKIDISVRWSSFVRDSVLKVYLVDVDSIQQTLKIKQADKFIDVFCPTMSETKYPNSFCYSYGDVPDSLDTVFGRLLPYIGKTASGIEYIMDNVSESDRRLLTVSVKKANASESDMNEALSSARSFTKSLGAGDDLFKFETRLEPMNGLGE